MKELEKKVERVSKMLRKLDQEATEREEAALQKIFGKKCPVSNGERVTSVKQRWGK